MTLYMDVLRLHISAQVSLIVSVDSYLNYILFLEDRLLCFNTGKSLLSLCSFNVTLNIDPNLIFKLKHVYALLLLFFL